MPSTTTMTPMMAQWTAVRERHRDGILFFRMGDFFEFFHDDAKTAARLLGLTLTSRSKGESSIPMAGVPVKSVEGYIARLVKAGEKVIICDQVEDPNEATGIVDRQVTRIVTPGTLTEDDALEEKDNNYLLAVDPREAHCALAWVDLSTGEFATAVLPADRWIDTALALDAAECLVRESFLDEDPGGPEVKERFACPVSRRPDWSFDADTARRGLNEHFGTRSLEGFGLDDDFPLGAAGAVLEYLRETQIGAVGQVRTIRRVRQGTRMVLDRATRSSLELVRTLRDNDRRGSLLDVMDRSATAMGARMLKAWILAPLVDTEAIRARQSGVAELVDDAERLGALRSALVDVLDMERLAGRIGCDRANPRDLLALRQSLESLPELVRTLSDAASPYLAELARAVPDMSELAELLGAALVDDPPITIKEGGMIRDGHDAELDELRVIGREGKGFIADFQARETERTGIPNLKIGFNRVFGYYIEITNVHKDKVPEGYVRKQTLKNAERYIVDELKEYETKVLNAEERLKSLEYDLFLELRRAAKDRLDDIQRAAGAVARMDVMHSLARLAREQGYVAPELTDEDEVEIEEGAHPVLLQRSTDEPFVPNDVRFGPDRRIVLITGPNMAGKSTYIRQVALITVMAQIGSFVPAKRARVGVVDRVFTRVGASDDLARGASTFMVEMLEVANILSYATERSLVILDEVGRGTSTYDGLSLAWAITEHLAAKLRCKTLFATHYHELTEIAETFPNVVNANVAVREYGEEIVFLHRIVDGATDKSYGIHVARLAGLPPAVLDGARRVLARLETRSGGPLPVADPPDELQLGLFAAEPAEGTLRTRLREMDVNEMTPMEALRVLDELVRTSRE